jgi:hypothetical protein
MDATKQWTWFDQGGYSERQRIVNLLQELRDSEYSELMTYDDLIEIIKGENK